MPKGKILVTGGAGFIGSHTTVELTAAGYEVVIVDDLSNSDITVVESVGEITGHSIPFEQVDCCDRSALSEVFRKHSFDAVIHFAASKAIGESVEQPLKYYYNNLTSFINVLELMRANGVEGVVFSSSATVYGQPDTLPATEQSPLKPATSPYGNTKQICEDILRDSLAAYKELKGIALRYFNPIGAHPTAKIGESPKGVPNNLVPFITQTAAGLHKGLSIFGDDYNTPDGSPLRDYIDIVDLAKAHVYAVARLLGNKEGERYEIFNIGTGTPVSVLELVKSFEMVNGIKIPYKIVARREGDVEAVWADTSLANKELGWKAERTLEQALAAAWAWEKRLRNL